MGVMSNPQKKKHSQVAKALIAKSSEFKKRHGARWKEVLHATATKIAMRETVHGGTTMRNVQEDKHTSGATKPESMLDKFTASDKKFADAHGGIDGNDSGIDGAKAAQSTADSIRNSGPAASHANREADQSTGDKAIVKKVYDITQRASYREAKTYEDLMKSLMEE